MKTFRSHKNNIVRTFQEALSLSSVRRPKVEVTATKGSCAPLRPKFSSIVSLKNAGQGRTKSRRSNSRFEPSIRISTILRAKREEAETCSFLPNSKLLLRQ